MTPGDIVLTPSGRLARYEGGTNNGAAFVYMKPNGKPECDRKSGNREEFVLRDLKALAAMKVVG
jgi:hypothetical protein